MRFTRLLLLLVLGVVYAVEQDAEAPADREKRSACDCGVSDVRLDAQESHLNQLIDEVDKLEDATEHHNKGTDHTTIEFLDHQLQDVESRGCGDHMFKCGAESHECIAHLKVCDGQNDCEHGQDEADFTCKAPAAAGNSFSGSVVYDRCTTRHPHVMTIEVTGTSKKDWWPNHLDVEANVIVKSKGRNYDRDANLPAEGYYNFAAKTLTLFPPESDRLGLLLDFHTGDDNVVNAYVTRESTQEKCALFVLKRV